LIYDYIILFEGYYLQNTVAIQPDLNFNNIIDTTYLHLS